MKHEIKVIFSDIDGTLTDGQLYYGPDGESIKVYNVKDGAGIKLWMAKGLEFGVITARSSAINAVRMGELGVKHVIIGAEDKSAILENWLSEHSLLWKNIAYIGDDINDIGVIEKAAISAAPADAHPKVVKKVAYCCKKGGGKGALREFIDFLLEDT